MDLRHQQESKYCSQNPLPLQPRNYLSKMELRLGHTKARSQTKTFQAQLWGGGADFAPTEKTILKPSLLKTHFFFFFNRLSNKYYKAGMVAHTCNTSPVEALRLVWATWHNPVKK